MVSDGICRVCAVLHFTAAAGAVPAQKANAFADAQTGSRDCGADQQQTERRQVSVAERHVIGGCKGEEFRHHIAEAEAPPSPQT